MRPPPLDTCTLHKTALITLLQKQTWFYSLKSLSQYTVNLLTALTGPTAFPLMIWEQNTLYIRSNTLQMLDITWWCLIAADDNATPRPACPDAAVECKRTAVTGQYGHDERVFWLLLASTEWELKMRMVWRVGCKSTGIVVPVGLRLAPSNVFGRARRAAGGGRVRQRGSPPRP